MPSFSPYAINESEPPKWRPGEDLASAAFVGISLWLIFDVNFNILRIFKRRKGLYYWSCQLGTIGCAVDALGVILKYLVPGSTRYWPLYTFMLLTGWATYAPFQLLVLYSRLHLVNNIPWIQKLVLGTIASTYITFVLPTWVVIWHSYNPNPAISSLWSPRNAIVERYTQIGFTLTECLVSGIYIWSLLGLLSQKSTVRQRRVMTDLIYVNVICVAFDIVVVVFIYMNQLGISHPIQTLSYALKFKLEFVVLNQLMAVAARGIQKNSWEERRYNHATDPNDFSNQCRRWASTANPISHPIDQDQDQPPDYNATQTTQEVSVPPSAMSRSNRSSILSLPPPDIDSSNLDTLNFGAEPKLELKSFYEEDEEEDKHSQTEAAQTIGMRPSQTFSGDTLQPADGEAREESPHLFPRLRSTKRKMPLQAIREHSNNKRTKQQGRRHGHPSQPPQQQQQNIDGGQGSGPGQPGGRPINATLRRHNPSRRRRSADDDDSEEEIGVHMWENRGKLILDAPWLKSKESV